MLNEHGSKFPTHRRQSVSARRDSSSVASRKPSGGRQEKERKAGSPSAPAGVDPDIADIKLGPQPPAEWQIEEDS